MTIDEEIKHQEEISDRYARMSEYEGNNGNDGIAEDCAQCAAEHRQIAEWLTELKQWRRVYGVCPSYEMCIPECKEGYNAQIAEYKRLLKVAVEDINSYVDCYEAHCDECCCSQDNHCHWKHEAEALKLIGETNEP